MIVNNGVTTLLTGEPVIHGTTADGSGIAVSVGRQVLVLNAADGTPSATLPFDQSVVDAKPIGGASDDPGFTVIACSNETANCIDLTDPQDVDNDGKRLSLPFPLRWAHLTQCAEYDVIVAVPADADNRIVSYRTNWSRGSETSDQYSLEELRALAEQTLAEGGRI